MKFANPEYLYLLAILPVMILLYLYSRNSRKRNIAKYGDPELVERLIPKNAKLRSKFNFWAVIVATALIIVALARPRYGVGKETITTMGVETVIALDISNSMLSDDESGSRATLKTTRLDKAKALVRRLIKQLEGNKVAMIVFAGDSYVQMPISEDNISAETFLSSITPDLIEKQGTDIAGALRLAMKSFTPNSNIGKAILLITDGEDHEGGAEEAAALAAENGINIFVLGIGSESGGRIPMGNDFIRDTDGSVVITKLNEEMAKNIALAGKGTYVRADNAGSAQDVLFAEFDKLAKEEVKKDVYTRYNEVFTIIMVVAFAMLFFDLIAKMIIDLAGRKK